MHFKLLNALCKQQAMEDRDKARMLHNDLLTSGMDRILVVSLFPLLLLLLFLRSFPFPSSSPSSPTLFLALEYQETS